MRRHEDFPEEHGTGPNPTKNQHCGEERVRNPSKYVVSRGRAGFTVSPTLNTWSDRRLGGVINGKHSKRIGNVDPIPNLQSCKRMLQACFLVISRRKEADRGDEHGAENAKNSMELPPPPECCNAVSRPLFVGLGGFILRIPEGTSVILFLDFHHIRWAIRRAASSITGLGPIKCQVSNVLRVFLEGGDVDPLKFPRLWVQDA